MGNQQLPTNKHLSQGATSYVLPLTSFLYFSPNQLLWLVCLGVASAWLLPQSLHLAPQCHCFPPYLSPHHLPSLFSFSTPPLFLILTALSPPPSLSLSLCLSHTHSLVIILFLAVSRSGALSLTRTHHFGQRDRRLNWQRLGPTLVQTSFTTSYWLVKLLSLCKIISSTLLVVVNKKTWNIYEVWACRDNSSSLCYSGFRRLRSFCIAPRAPQTWRREAKWNFMKAPSGANTASRPSPVCQPANHFYCVLKGNNKAPLFGFQSVIFFFFYCKWTCFFKLFFNVLLKRKLMSSVAADPERTLTAGSCRRLQNQTLCGEEKYLFSSFKSSAFSLIMLRPTQPYVIPTQNGQYDFWFLPAVLVFLPWHRLWDVPHASDAVLQ